MSTRREVALDIILAGSLCAWGQAEVWNSGASLLVGPKWANAIGYAVMSVLLLARRRAPGRVLGGQSAVLIVLVTAYGASETLGWFLPLVAGVYGVAAYGRQRRLLIAAALVILSGTSASAQALTLQKLADYPLPGDTSRYDYLSFDPTSNRMYIAHLGQGVIHVFDTQAKKDRIGMNVLAIIDGSDQNRKQPRMITVRTGMLADSAARNG